jgi:hypothetical protein
MGIFYIIVAIRYKSLIRLMYIFIALEYSFRVILGHLKPITTAGTARGSILNYIMIPLALLSFIASINNAKNEK